MIITNLLGLNVTSSWSIFSTFIDTHREKNNILLSLVQQYIEIKAWLHLSFFYIFTQSVTL